jgi:hypothetical protein
MNAPARLAPPRARPKGGPPLSIDRIPENARASDQNARAFSSTDQLAAAIEKEIERIRVARPRLSSRLDRASNLLLLQLASPPRQRPVKVRIAADGRRCFLVSSASSGGVVYSVDPATYACSCPDAHRRGIGCKHGLCCFILRRVARTQRRGCSTCERGWVYRAVKVVNPATGELVDATNPTRCTRCGDGFSHEFVQQWLESQSWIFAKNRADNPHFYCLRRNAGDEAIFERIVEFIRERGVPYLWWGRHYLQYVAGEWAYWTMGSPIPETSLINRKSLEQVRLDQLRNRGGGGVQWGWLHSDIEAEREELRLQEAGQEELGQG